MVFIRIMWQLGYHCHQRLTGVTEYDDSICYCHYCEYSYYMFWLSKGFELVQLNIPLFSIFSFSDRVCQVSSDFSRFLLNYILVWGSAFNRFDLVRFKIESFAYINVFRSLNQQCRIAEVKGLKDELERKNCKNTYTIYLVTYSFR